MNNNYSRNKIKAFLKKEPRMKNITFVFEDIVEYRNLIDCVDTNSSGIKRFTTSPVVANMIRYCDQGITLGEIDYSRIKYLEFSHTMNLKDYIIAMGVAHSPIGWCGPCNDIGVDYNYPEKKNLFYYLNSVYLKDLKNSNAYLLLDQTHEGYHEEWLFDWFHNSCSEYSISPSRIIYVTGNMTVQDQYITWCNDRNVIVKMTVIPEAHFEHCAFITLVNRVKIDNEEPLPSFNDHIEYKKKNARDIKLYNLLQKRPRAHRSWMFKKIIENDLAQFGINTMNFFEQHNTYYFGKVMEEEEYRELAKMLPMLPLSDESYEVELQEFSDMDSGKYVTKFNEDTLIKSWVSIISEASFGEDTCFISEKTFKVIAAGHPFIILGNKHSLKSLHEMGYKTFHPFIDESYDELNTWERMDSIVKCVKDLTQKSQEELLVWYNSIESILEHNIKNLEKRSTMIPSNASVVLFRNT